MKKIIPSDVTHLLTGALFYGTGGGGNPIRAKQIMQSLSQNNALPALIGPKDLNTLGVCITGFPVGGLRADIISNELLRTMLARYQTMFDQSVQAIIPVEIGPLSLAVSMELGSILRLPVVDADVVGGRSTPEVFLETITLFSIPRTPMLVFNAKGNYKTLTKNVSCQREEQFLRSFAVKSGGFAYVFGYPLTKRVILRSVTQSTVSQAMRVGSLIRRKMLSKNLTKIGATTLFSGTISSIKLMKQSGFSSKFVEIKNGKQKAKVYIKNENIILWINDKVSLTCPDLLVLMNNDYFPVFNEDLRVNMQVSVLGVKSVPLWKTPKGKKLFHPSLFGFKIPQVLL